MNRPKIHKTKDIDCRISLAVYTFTFLLLRCGYIVDMNQDNFRKLRF